MLIFFNACRFQSVVFICSFILLFSFVDFFLLHRFYFPRSIFLHFSFLKFCVFCSSYFSSRFFCSSIFFSMVDLCIFFRSSIFSVFFSRFFFLQQFFLQRFVFFSFADFGFFCRYFCVRWFCFQWSIFCIFFDNFSFSSTFLSFSTVCLFFVFLFLHVFVFHSSITFCLSFCFFNGQYMYSPRLSIFFPHFFLNFVLFCQFLLDHQFCIFSFSGIVFFRSFFLYPVSFFRWSFFS